MSEVDSEGGFSDEDTSSVGGPSVMTFQDPSKKPEGSVSDKTLKKAFMVRVFKGFTFDWLDNHRLQSSKVSKLRQETTNLTKKAKPNEGEDLDSCVHHPSPLCPSDTDAIPGRTGRMMRYCIN